MEAVPLHNGADHLVYADRFPCWESAGVTVRDLVSVAVLDGGKAETFQLANNVIQCHFFNPLSFS